MLRKIVRLLLSRRTLIIILLLCQVYLTVSLIVRAAAGARIITAVFNAISIIAVLYIVNRRDKPAYKVTWIVLILIFPLLGGALYLMFRLQSSVRHLRRKFSKYNVQKLTTLRQDEALMAEIRGYDKDIASQAEYLSHTVGYPVYNGTTAEYLPSGEAFFESLKQELSRAEKFIFLEYFIIDPGYMWDSVLCILREKAAAGVDVRIIYDDMACMLTLPDHYRQTMAEYGIKCLPFNPFRPFWTTLQNNRNHRKITVIDGRAAFTGGSNLADEYINRVEKFGHWKDSSLLIHGDAVRSFVVMFLDMWDSIRADEEEFTYYFQPLLKDVSQDGLSEDELMYAMPAGKSADSMPGLRTHEYVQPYTDSPTDGEYVGEQVYLQVINDARDYLYITTPYLIIDDVLTTALLLAAKSGVDVRIITPHIPDKKLVHLTTRSSYAQLIEGGIRIYEYTPGFIHSKMMLADDRVGVIGTANLDFRSLCLHFECGVRMYNTRAIYDMKNDFMSTLTECKEIDRAFCEEQSLFIKLLQDVMRLCAPLM